MRGHGGNGEEANLGEICSVCNIHCHLGLQHPNGNGVGLDVMGQDATVYRRLPTAPCQVVLGVSLTQLLPVELQDSKVPKVKARQQS